MSDVYMVRKEGETVPMRPLQCKDETRELQDLLEKNHDLLASDQINPGERLRWLLIRREMDVPDPGSGNMRWQVDFFFTDQNAMPTFVECKRFEDTGARRKVIGQMLEYVANSCDWSKEDLKTFAAETARKRGFKLEEVLSAFLGKDESVDDFFEEMADNLQQGQVRLIFFLDQAPPELKSIVKFLNDQMGRTEVLLVEAKQFEKDGVRVVVPTLFGYSEEARRVKETLARTESSPRTKWNEKEFFGKARDSMSGDQFNAVRRLHDTAKDEGYTISWGTGKRGSYGLVAASLCPRSVITVTTSGRLELNLGWLDGNSQVEALRDELAKRVAEEMELAIPKDYVSERKLPGFSHEEWVPKSEVLTKILVELAHKYSAPVT